MKEIAIVGSGSSSLSAACYLAQAGNDVTVFEKNRAIGGRAGQFKKDAFTFDTGSTFYRMPDVFNRFFSDFNRNTSDYYELSISDPGYSVYFEKDDSLGVSVCLDKLYNAFEKEEAGSSKSLKEFISMAEFNYNAAMDKIIYRPGKSPIELVTFATMSRLNQFVTSISKTIRKTIKIPRLIKILEFPAIFLGGKPKNIPTFYCFMEYADMVLGTWHPKGGFCKVIEGFGKLANELGVKIRTNAPVEKIEVNNNVASGLIVNKEFLAFDFIISGADYHHTEILLDAQHKNYKEAYWERKTFAPSVLLFFVGFDKKLKNVNYRSDDNMAPKGKEAGVLLIPLAPGLEDSESMREDYFKKLITRIKRITDQSLGNNILFKKSFGVNDFVADYNAYKGNAHGLANTLMQTAFRKPKMENKKVNNLVYSGQLTVPGQGVFTTIISGKSAAGLSLEKLKKQ